MKNRNKQGFTLIELLVVVLIIGILAAVALPQYQKAVMKSRAMQGLAILDSFVKAQEVYKLENGRYAETDEELATLVLDVPSTPEWTAFVKNPNSPSKGYLGVTDEVEEGGDVELYYFTDTKRKACMFYVNADEKNNICLLFPNEKGERYKKWYQIYYLN